jgi:hypothetical protein
MTLLVIILVWFLVGFASGVYVLLVDSLGGAMHCERPIALLMVAMYGGLWGPLTLGFALWVAYDTRNWDWRKP